MMPVRPRLLATCRASARILVARFGAVVALGGAVVLSLLSVCCGVGVLATPWLLCELYAVQLAQAIGGDVARTGSWFGAGAILLAAVLLVTSVAWLTSVGLGASPLEAAVAVESASSPLAASGALIGLLSAAISLAFVLPFFSAPVILIDQRAGIGGAVLESARLVIEGGVLSHLLLSFVQNALQVSPLLAAGLLSAWLDPGRTAWWILGSVPLLALTLPLGQGMVVAAYADSRGALADPQRTRVAGRPPRALAMMWSLRVFLPLLSFGLLGASLVRPAKLSHGPLPPGGERVAVVAAGAVPHDRTTALYLPGTALQLDVAHDRVAVAASDGGGAGPLPLLRHGDVQAVHAVRRGDSFGIEVRQAGGVSHTHITRAGVRLDDDLRSRLLDRVSLWELGVMLLSLLSTACALLPVLASFARVRRMYTLQLGERPAPERVSYLRARSHRRAALAAIPLSLLSALSLFFGIESWLGM